MIYKPLFPWFGGKSWVSDITWLRLGNVQNYVEPFFGSGAILFKRPHEPRIETVNDLDCYVSNFWRALQAAPDEVEKWADWPVNECDLSARHLWLVERKVGFADWLRADPDHYDAKVAGWWVWGICQWIGGGWCAVRERPKQQRPHLSSSRGIHRPPQKRPHLRGAGVGIHRPKQQRPHLGRPSGVHAGKLPLLHQFSDRLRNVRVCCGDWTRVLGTTPTVHNGLTGVFLDPPYTDAADRDAGIYAEDSLTVGRDVCDWALAHGDNPQLRIAVCGYEGEYEFPDSWECVAWKATGGYAVADHQNARRERIWFSPHCLKPAVRQSLFDDKEIL